tara:strand:+ start:8502 stop:9725 length:1224 start_codon:yes stop_codon:yes gene_type:complete
MKTLLFSIHLTISIAFTHANEDTIDSLKEWISIAETKRTPIINNEFANAPISKEEAQIAKEILWEDHISSIKASRAEEMEKKVISLDGKTMKFDYLVFGEMPEEGRSLYISMHGGGGAPAQVNDGQWKNQMRLYKPKEGIYLCPRAPTNTWNLWHQSHIDTFFDRLIENLIVFKNVNPEKVYLMGYSAGGDGVYQLAPRMCDRFAAAAMMAGHPNESTPQGLRNLPFALQVGENDKSYGRNKIAASWGNKLAKLREKDPKGYIHFTKIHKGKGHWMNLEDKIAVPWMAKYKRNRIPNHIVWKQDDVTHDRSYWISLPKDQIKPRQLITASRKNQRIDLHDMTEVSKIEIMLNDDMINFDEPVTVHQKNKLIFEGKVNRSISEIHKTLKERGDPGLIFSARLNIELKN